jgi:hypothetical protein
VSEGSRTEAVSNGRGAGARARAGAANLDLTKTDEGGTAADKVPGSDWAFVWHHQ